MAIATELGAEIVYGEKQNVRSIHRWSLDGRLRGCCGRQGREYRQTSRRGALLRFVTHYEPQRPVA